MKGLREIANDNAVESPTKNFFDAPLPGLQTREIVKNLVEGIVETVEQTSMTPAEADKFTLGMIRGARVTVAEIGEDDARLYVARLLDVHNHGGFRAIAALAETVSGKLPEAA